MGGTDLIDDVIGCQDHALTLCFNPCCQALPAEIHSQEGLELCEGGIDFMGLSSGMHTCEGSVYQHDPHLQLRGVLYIYGSVQYRSCD